MKLLRVAKGSILEKCSSAFVVLARGEISFNYVQYRTVAGQVPIN